MLRNSATRRNSATVRSEDLQIQKKNTPKLREGRFRSLRLFRGSLITSSAEKQFFSVVIVAFISKLKHFKVTN